MSVECIICRELKDNFTPEHVIPAAIGNKFIIKTACSDCNQLLGDNIDSPFCNHKQVLYYRNLFNLNRGARGIANPFYGKFKDSNGKQFVVEFNGYNFRAEYTPAFHYDETEKDPVGRLSISKKFLTPEILDRYVKKMEQETGFPLSHYTTDTEVPEPPTIQVIDQDNKIILECIKIGYEAAVSCIPEYFLDEMAIYYSKVLRNYSLDHNLSYFITPPLNVRQMVVAEIKKSQLIERFPCFIYIQNIPGIGLTAAFKFFTVFHCIILSSKQSYIDERKLILFNDPMEEKFNPFFIKPASSFSFTLEGAQFSEEHRNELQKAGSDYNKLFINDQSLIPIYDKEGNINLHHIEMLLLSTIGHIKYERIATINSIEFETENGFLKSNKSNLFYPISKINIHY